MKVLGDREVWFVTGSQALYGDDALATVSDHANEIARALDEADPIPVRILPKPVVATAEAIREVLLAATVDPACIGVIAWMHTFSPARMWIAGLQGLQKPLLHLHTQHNRDLPWAEIDMDFMNLNQSAHGDREFGFIESRLRLGRTTVVGHWQDRTSSTGSRPGPGPPAASMSSGDSSSPASGTTCARSRSPRATRSRPRFSARRRRTV